MATIEHDASVARLGNRGDCGLEREEAFGPRKGSLILNEPRFSGRRHEASSLSLALLALLTLTLLNIAQGASAQPAARCASDFLDSPAATPKADGDDDGNTDDYLIGRWKYSNTWVENWCIDDRSGGSTNSQIFFALLVDGVGGNVWRLAGKCGFDPGWNEWFADPDLPVTGETDKPLNNTRWENYAGVKKETATKVWIYKFNPTTGEVSSIKKSHPGGTVLSPLQTTPAPTRGPDMYEGLRGGPDAECLGMGHEGVPGDVPALVAPALGLMTIGLLVGGIVLILRRRVRRKAQGSDL